MLIQTWAELYSIMNMSSSLMMWTNVQSNLSVVETDWVAVANQHLEDAIVPLAERVVLGDDFYVIEGQHYIGLHGEGPREQALAGNELVELIISSRDANATGPDEVDGLIVLPPPTNFLEFNSTRHMFTGDDNITILES